MGWWLHSSAKHIFILRLFSETIRFTLFSQVSGISLNLKFFPATETEQEEANLAELIDSNDIDELQNNALMRFIFGHVPQVAPKSKVEFVRVGIDVESNNRGLLDAFNINP